MKRFASHGFCTLYRTVYNDKTDGPLQILEPVNWQVVDATESLIEDRIDFIILFSSIHSRVTKNAGR